MMQPIVVDHDFEPSLWDISVCGQADDDDIPCGYAQYEHGELE